jgi:signal transduction histidine kinase
VADASHELRTPITAIRGFSELHRQGAVTGEKETAELIARIENESKRMGSLVEDLLLLARLDQAREMESKPVDINKVVVAKSTPTFATNDNVIIEEVKLLLPKKTSLNNLQNMVSMLSSDEFNTLEEAANFLNTEDEPIDISIEIEKIEDNEDPDSEDDDPENGLGLQSFVNKLKGGKNLRRRMRREMAKSKRKLANDMKIANPNAPANKKSELEALKAELATLKDNYNKNKEKLTATIALMVSNPLSTPVYAPLIALLKKQQKEIQNAISQKIKDIKKLDPGFRP